MPFDLRYMSFKDIARVRGCEVLDSVEAEAIEACTFEALSSCEDGLYEL
jgi:hypothetical protein